MADPIVGSTKTLRSVWTDSDGAPINPVVVLTVKDPADNVTTPAVLNPSVGTFTSQVTFDLEGFWYYEWEGTTSEGTTICSGHVCVYPSSVLVSS
jgi:hypothetical protein